MTLPHERVYSRATPSRFGWVIEVIAGDAWLVDWDDGETEWVDMDHLGHVPTTEAEIAAARERTSLSEGKP